jgi:uncharacterized MAPEG superfamily protein
MTLSSNPAFLVYVLATLVLCANLVFLWGYSGAARGKTQTAINPEDAATVAKGAQVTESDPPEVARVLRAHRNAEANIYPFLALGLVFVLLGGPAEHAKVLFAVFVGARLLHSIVYLAGKQPWRTLSFGVGALALLGLMGDIVWLLVK